MYRCKFFSKAELACKCGCGRMPTLHMQAAADRIREAWGHPLVCTSGARCEAYTRELIKKGIPAALRSAHIEGLALDLVTLPPYTIDNFKAFLAVRLEELGVWMEDPNFTKTWVHVQIRPASGRMFVP